MSDKQTRQQQEEIDDIVEEAIERFNRRRAEQPNPLRENPRDPESPFRNPIAWRSGGGQ